MESTAMAILFIIGKAAIWLVLPLLFGIYELVRHRKRMAAEARGETTEPTIPGWLQATPRRTVPARQPAADDAHVSAGQFQASAVPEADDERRAA